MDKVVLHSDINSCFANIECLYNPSLRGKPVSVCGSIEERHGIVLASTIEAKRRGVKTGEAIWQARQKCPELITVTPNYDRYVRFSKLARNIYADYTDMVEPFGLDEAFLDVTGHPDAKDGGVKIADEIRRRIKYELGITVSVGASFNKIFAKLGSDLKKPDAITAISRENFKTRVWPLPVEALLYAGRSTTRRLHECGIKTIGELAMCREDVLKNQLGKMGSVLWGFANGYDATPVARLGDFPAAKSISHGTTPPRNMENFQDAEIIITMLSESVTERLRSHGFKAGTVYINFRDTALNHYQRRHKLSPKTALSAEISSAATALLREAWDFSVPLRSITVGTSDFSPDALPVQLSVFSDEEQRIKLERLDNAIDDIRRRFGHYSIMRAVTCLDDTLGCLDAKNEHVSYPVGFFKEYRQ